MLLPPRLAGRLAAVLYGGVAEVVLLLSLVLSGYSQPVQFALALMAVVVGCCGIAFWRLPWDRWPRQALLVIIPISCALIIVANLIAPINPYRYEITLFGLFAWIGLACRRGTALAALPFLVATYMLPLLAAGHLSHDALLGLVLVAFFCTLLAEALAWFVVRLGRAQSALRESEARYRAISEQGRDILTIVDEAGRIVYVSPAVRRILGHDPAALVGTSYLDLMHPDDAAAVDDRLVFDASAPVEARVRHGDGSWRWLEHATRDARADPHIGGFLTTSRDISERRQAQRALEQAGAAATELARLRQEQARAAEAMSEVSVALGGSLALTDLYGLILQQAAKVLPYDYAQILVPSGHWFALAAYQGEPAPPLGTHLFALAPDSVGWRRLLQGRPTLMRDTADDREWRDVPPRDGAHRIRSLVSIPILIDGEVQGVFEVASMTPNFYDDGHIQVAAAFGDRIMQAVRNARLFEAERQRARAAEELAQMRDDFVAAVSHELRTPLTAIIGYAELLRAHWTRLDEERRLEHIRRIAFAASRQQRLVEDLLLVRRHGAAVPNMRIAVVSLARLAGEAAEMVRLSYPGQRINLAGPGEARAYADPARLVQVLANLIDNAAKYSPEGSPIAVEWGLDGAMATVRVKDRGPGVPEVGRERLFTRFGRLPASQMRAGRVGTGLGLFLGRQIIEAMDGILDLESTGPLGSTFRLCLPAPPAEALD